MMDCPGCSTYLATLQRNSQSTMFHRKMSTWLAVTIILIKPKILILTINWLVSILFFMTWRLVPTLYSSSECVHMYRFTATPKPNLFTLHQHNLLFHACLQNMHTFGRLPVITYLPQSCLTSMTCAQDTCEANSTLAAPTQTWLVWKRRMRDCV